jgi:hypothetical protein
MTSYSSLIVDFVHAMPPVRPTPDQYPAIALDRISFYIVVLMDAKLLRGISSARWVLPAGDRAGGE